MGMMCKVRGSGNGQICRVSSHETALSEVEILKKLRLEGPEGVDFH